MGAGVVSRIKAYGTPSAFRVQADRFDDDTERALAEFAALDALKRRRQKSLTLP